MPKRVLVVADPPHAATLDRAALAKQLGLPVAEVQQRLTFPLPEVWAIAADSAAAAAQADALARAGAKAVGLRAGVLAHVPAAETVDRFELEDAGIAWTRVSGGKAALAWSSVRALLFMRRQKIVETPSRVSGRGRSDAGLAQVSDLFGGAVAGAMGEAASDLGAGLRELSRAPKSDFQLTEVLEIAGMSADGPLRIRLLRDRVDYISLGALRQNSVQLNWTSLQRVVSERSALSIDRRAEKIPGRPTVVAGRPLLAHFAGAAESLRARLADPFEFACAFVCAQRGVLAARPL